MSLHIISGIFKGRPLKTPKKARTRPTSALVRKAVFDISRPILEGASLLDLFAGSGAIGFEALSQGATHVTFVEENKEAIRCIYENAKNLGVEKAVHIIWGKFPEALKKIYHKPFQFIYIDPPYGEKAGDEVAQELVNRGLIDHKGKLFFENSQLTDIQVIGFHKIRSQKYGRTFLDQFTYMP